MAEIYGDSSLFDTTSLKIDEFNLDDFKDFIEEKSNNNLEATSTILYLFKNKKDSFNRNNCISALNELKPNISFETKMDAFNNVDEFGLINKMDYVVSQNEINGIKSSLNLKIKCIQEAVEPLDICHNHILIMGSLEYMRIVMKIENIGLSYKKDLIDFITFYVSHLSVALNNLNDLINHDLAFIERLFNQFQNYVSGELNIIPRVDDENFNYADYY